MFLKQTPYKHTFYNEILKPIHHARGKTQGSALVMALFIIVVVLMLGTALVKVLQSGEESIAYQVIGTRAYAAANSGAQFRLQQLFPLQPNTIQRCGVVNANDESTSTSQLVTIKNANGLQSCIATIDCSDFSHSNVVYYTIKSTGQCGSGSDVETSRTIEIQARSL